MKRLSDRCRASRSNLELLRQGDEVKFVISSRRDYDWAREVLLKHRLHERVSVLFSPQWHAPVRQQLAAWMLEDGVPARFQLQLHKLIWPGVERGV